MPQHSTAILRRDYRPYTHRVISVALDIDLDEVATRVRARIKLSALTRESSPLVLNGEGLSLQSVHLNGVPLESHRYQIDDESLTIPVLPSECTLETVAIINPSENTSLMGLYCVDGQYITQCEAEGFRKITWFPDRPDVMSVYTVRITGDKEKTPIMLSNGNCIAEGVSPDGRFFVEWHDPFPKPSYLFALVAGHFASLERKLRTRSGKPRLLQIYASEHDREKTEHAMESLVNAMRWDERRYGLELDLQQYMIVATPVFNMGAMENKGLNVFNTKCVLADARTATDGDFAGVASVVAHEYFHNWTGNRVTCRDWFQLSLKEGLTVFRDQEFSADMAGSESGRAVVRIARVRNLRTAQFSEDAGPMAHPVRPNSYVEISNFYTATVYEKGAEVVRMYQTLLGIEGFRHGLQLYFQRHDGQAATCDDFLNAMSDANPGQLSESEKKQYDLWYSEAGTPRLRISSEYDPHHLTFILRVSQSCPPSPGQSDKKPFLIPLTVALLHPRTGAPLSLVLEGDDMVSRKKSVSKNDSKNTTKTLRVRGQDNVFVFQDVPLRPIPSLLRDFSAPVILEYEYTDEELIFLMTYDDDSFNRWEAGQRLYTRILMKMIREIRAGQSVSEPPLHVLQAINKILHSNLDAIYKVEMLQFPSELFLAEQLDEVDPMAIHQASIHWRQYVAKHNQADLWKIARRPAHKEYRFDVMSAGERGLKGLAWSLLAEQDEPTIRVLLWERLQKANNMTDQINALAPLMFQPSVEREQSLKLFYTLFEEEALVVDKWFSLQATARGANTLAQVRALLKHPAFSLQNPNRARSLISSFCYANPSIFHAIDGSGYEFWAEQVLVLDAFNPQLAARLAKAVNSWEKLEPKRRALLHKQITRVSQFSRLSKDTREVIDKTLGVGIQ